MKILAFETSAKSASVAVAENGVPVALSYQCTGLTHSRTLMPMAEALLQNSDLTLQEIDALAVAVGPGSFTGLRIGVAAVKGLAWARELPCVGVSTLAAMAQNLAHLDAVLICAMDARRGQFYNAVFRAEHGALTRLTPDRAIDPGALAAELRAVDGVKWVLGDGGALCHGFLTEQGIDCRLAPAQLRMQSAVGVALAAEPLLAAGESVCAQALRPVYLRISQAERERLAREQTASQK